MTVWFKERPKKLSNEVLADGNFDRVLKKTLFDSACYASRAEVSRLELAMLRFCVPIKFELRLCKAPNEQYYLIATSMRPGD